MRRRRQGGPFSPALADRWQAPDAGARYSIRRWNSARAAGRDLLLVRRILSRHGVEPSRGGVLDAPCGGGRLRPVLAGLPGGYVGLDASLPMLRAAGGEEPARLVLGAMERLPFADDTFDVVVACRILHHVHDPDELAGLVYELTRVSARLVVASFWDTASLPALRVRIGLRGDEGPAGRRAVSKEVLRRTFREAGAEVVAFYHTFRFVSQQAFLVAHKKARVRSPLREAAERARASLRMPAGVTGVPGGAEGALGGA